ncbi:MAG: hypothetical protein ACPGQN_06185, partial [Candidatus Poseidoniaceae archaeon]
MSDEVSGLQDSDFGQNRSRIRRYQHALMELPSRLRLAGQSAWRGKERGMAVIAGVFLASLVITTVLAYGVGLSQLFFEESLDSEPFDAKIEFARTPVENASGLGLAISKQIVEAHGGGITVEASDLGGAKFT